MRFLWVLIIGISICSCNRDPFYPLSEKEKIVNEILKKTSMKLAHEKGLIPFGEGGRMMDQIKMLSLAFLYRHPIDIEEGRELLVFAVQEFLAEVNANERVRPYLNNFPFEPKNISLSIYLQNRDGSTFGAGKLSAIWANEGMMQYKIEDSNKRLEKIHQETYQEALQIVEHIY